MLRSGIQLQAVFVSPLRRALQTAQAVVDGMGSAGAARPPVFVAEALREQYCGLPADQRRPLSLVRTEHPAFDTAAHVQSDEDPWATARRPAESPADLSARCVEVLTLLRRCPYPRVLVVSHERILRHLLAESGLHVVPAPPQTREAAAATAEAGGLAPDWIRPFEPCDLRSYAVGGWAIEGGGAELQPTEQLDAGELPEADGLPGDLLVSAAAQTVAGSGCCPTQ